MKKLFLLVIIACGISYGATGDITAVSVNTNGYSGQCTVEGIDSGGVYVFNRTTFGRHSATTPYLTVKSFGYDSTGARVFVDRTVHIDTVFRKNFPLVNSDSATIAGGDVTFTFHLEEPVCIADTVKGVYFPDNCYHLVADTQNVYTASSATNNSTLTYRNFKAGTKWTWPDRSCYDTSFWVSVTGDHISGDSGKLFRAAIFSAEDNHSNVFLDTITSSVAGGHPYTDDSLKIEEYRCRIITDSFTKGDSITVNVKLLPKWGDSIWTGDGVNTTKPTPLYAPQYYLYAEYHDVMIDATDGDDGTGVVTNHDDFDIGSPPAAFQTMAGAMNGTRTHTGTADISGTRFHMRADDYTYFGGTVTGGTKAAFNLEFISYPGEVADITAAGGTTAMPVSSYLKFDRITFSHSSGNMTYIEKSVWLDSCIDNRTGGSLCYYNPCNYLTACKINYDLDRPFSTGNDPLAIVRGCEFKSALNSTIVPYCFIGNSNTVAGNVTFKLEYAGMTAPKPDGSIIGWCNLITNTEILNIYADSSNDHGFFMISDIIESFDNTGPLMSIAAGNNSMSVINVGIRNCGFFGERVNQYYNNYQLTDSTNLRMRVCWWEYNNFFHRSGSVSDKDAHEQPAGNQRQGNWHPYWGTSFSGNIRYDKTSFYNDNFGNNFLNNDQAWNQTGIVNTWCGFVGDGSWAGSNAGGGDYHLAAGSPAVNFALVEHQSLKYDLDGELRGLGVEDDSAAIGPYGYDEGAPPTTQFTLDTVIVCPSGTCVGAVVVPSTTVDSNTACSTQVSPGAGYRCDSIVTDGTIAGRSVTTADTAAHNVMVENLTDSIFYSRVQYVLTMTNDGNGTTTPVTDTTVDSGTVANIGYSAATNYHWGYWSVPTGTVVFNGDSTTANVQSTSTLLANFYIDTVYLSNTPTAQGAVTYLGDSIAAYGGTIRVYLTVTAGYVGSWDYGSFITGVDSQDVIMYADSAITVETHAIPTYTVDSTVTDGRPDSVELSECCTVDSGTVLTVTINNPADTQCTVSGDTSGVLTSFSDLIDGNKSYIFTFDAILQPSAATTRRRSGYLNSFRDSWRGGGWR